MPNDEWRRQRQARVMRVVNVPMRLILRLPFPTPLNSQLMLLTFTGRRSGKVYHQPVSYVRDGETLLTPGGGRWTLNLTEGRPVRSILRGRAAVLRPHFVRDPGEVRRLLGIMREANPRLSSFIPFMGKDGSIDEEQLAAGLAHGFCVIRWTVGDAGLPEAASTSTPAPERSPSSVPG
jgi:hypothetical protein